MNNEPESVIPKNTEPINFTNYTDGQLTPNFTLYTVDDIFKSSRLFIIISGSGSFFPVLHLLFVCGSFRCLVHVYVILESFLFLIIIVLCNFFFLSRMFQDLKMNISSFVRSKNKTQYTMAMLHIMLPNAERSERKPIHFHAHNIEHISNLHADTSE